MFFCPAGLLIGKAMNYPGQGGRPCVQYLFLAFLLKRSTSFNAPALYPDLFVLLTQVISTPLSLHSRHLSSTKALVAAHVESSKTCNISISATWCNAGPMVSDDN